MQLITFLNTKSNDFFEKVLQTCVYNQLVVISHRKVTNFTLNGLTRKQIIMKQIIFILALLIVLMPKANCQEESIFNNLSKDEKQKTPWQSQYTYPLQPVPHWLWQHQSLLHLYHQLQHLQIHVVLHLMQKALSILFLLTMEDYKMLYPPKVEDEIFPEATLTATKHLQLKQQQIEVTASQSVHI